MGVKYYEMHFLLSLFSHPPLSLRHWRGGKLPSVLCTYPSLIAHCKVRGRAKDAVQWRNLKVSYLAIEMGAM